MTESALPPPDVRPQQRRTGLILLGVLHIVLGGLSALMVPLMILGAIAATAIGDPSASSMDASAVVSGCLLYAAIAVWFVCMGIGSIMARRWARALVLVASWIWLVGGVAALLGMLLLMPDMYAPMAETGQIPQLVASIMQYVLIAFMAVIGIVIPAGLVMFYRRRSVKETCESINPRACWTDRCPLPVLAVSLVFAFWAVAMPLMGAYSWALPFFGRLLSGMAGAGVALASMVLAAYVAWGAYRLSTTAWWCAVLLTVAGALSACITFRRIDMLEFYEAMNLPDQQMELIKQYSMPEGSVMAVWSGLFAAAFLAYLLYTRRYFGLPSEDEHTR